MSFADCRASGPVPLTEDKDALKAHVQSLTANGGTAGHIGLAWGWYLISPSWNSIWPQASKPLDYDAKHNMKAVILMTDGDFNSYHPTAGKSSLRREQDLCHTVKAEPAKITVYTVGFQVPSNVQKTGDGRTILEYCATTPAYAFNASNGNELAAAYRSIAQSISELRIKQKAFQADRTWPRRTGHSADHRYRALPHHARSRAFRRDGWPPRICGW